VHIPTWDSSDADAIWTEACGKERWRGMPDRLKEGIATVPDEKLWAMRSGGRQKLVAVVRRHLALQLHERGASKEEVLEAETTFDANVLTLGFARRFTEYKRPNLLLRDMERFDALLRNEDRPVQIVVAGKAHPADTQGKWMIQAWLDVARRPQYRRRIAFLEDYDIDVAQELVQGVDLWINTPRRPWEACGTSGMKVLVNGGLNCSILDGWWDEAFEHGVGWAVGNRAGGHVKEVDAFDAESLYSILETEVVPEFYDRDADGLPRAWLARIRRSMSELTPMFAGTRMLRDYVDKAYLPMVESYRARTANDAALARDMNAWARKTHRNWNSVHIGQPTAAKNEEGWRFSVPVMLGEVPPDSVAVELFANEEKGFAAEAVALHREQAIPGTVNGYVYAGTAPAARESADYTVRLVPHRAGVHVPAEMPLIAWQR
jgi:starch phosphorylase